MAEKLRLGCDVRELKIGASFLNDRSSAFHTLKCDFKPASVDASKMATVDVGTNNQVTVTVPHLDGAGVPQTVFKGNQRPYHKECVLIIDRITGEMTLEKLSTNIQVKKTRQEPVHKIAPPPPRPADTSANNCTQRSSSRTRVTTSGRRPAPVPASCTPPPPRHRSEIPQAAPWTVNSGQSTLASLPMIGLMEDDMTQPSGGHPVHIPLSLPPPLNGHNMETPNTPKTRETEEVGVLSSSSGSSSSGSETEHSDSGGSESEAETNHPPPNHSKPTINGGMNGSTLNNAEASMPMHLLNDDLCLSESGSDSD